VRIRAQRIEEDRRVKPVERSFCEDCFKKNAFPFKAFVMHGGARVIEN
jgi:hypothetical protein